jgi:GNAT superfamily N-acetyltransferase
VARTRRARKIGSTSFDVRPIAPSHWTALERLFGERGACGGCWCMAWRRPGREWEEHRGASNRRALKRLVEGAVPPGVLALERGEAVGWCSVAPRAQFRSLETKRSLATDWDEGTWSVTCFFVRKDRRGAGVGEALLAGAVRFARARGARRLEGYPAVPTKGALPSAFAWTGLPSMFERAGFERLTETPGRRPIYSLALRAARGPSTAPRSRTPASRSSEKE